MPLQASMWTEFLSCPICARTFSSAENPPISLPCGHTLCEPCLTTLLQKKCPFDQTLVRSDASRLPYNTALLRILNERVRSEDDHVQRVLTFVDEDRKQFFDYAMRSVEGLAQYLQPASISAALAADKGGVGCGGQLGGGGAMSVAGGGGGSLSSSVTTLGPGGAVLLSRPMQRKIVSLLHCQMADEEGRCRAMRSARSIGERTVTELILQHQNPQQLSANLWAAVRARGCQFLGPAMQEEVLRLILLALEDGSALSRKVLVLFVVQRLEGKYPQASKTAIGHVVQLLYRASCFKVTKREDESSLMQLKEEYCSYDELRREHDAQIVQIANEAGLRIAPDQWSSLLYGDALHKSHMQSIIDRLQTPQSFAQSVNDFVIALQRTNDPAGLVQLRVHLELLANVNPGPTAVTAAGATAAADAASIPTWDSLTAVLNSAFMIVTGLVDFVANYSSRKLDSFLHNMHPKYKTSMCRDFVTKDACPRGNNCTFAHSDDELEKFRARNKRFSKQPASQAAGLNAKEQADLKYVSTKADQKMMQQQQQQQAAAQSVLARHAGAHQGPVHGLQMTSENGMIPPSIAATMPAGSIGQHRLMSRQMMAPPPPPQQQQQQQQRGTLMPAASAGMGPLPADADHYRHHRGYYYPGPAMPPPPPHRFAASGAYGGNGMPMATSTPALPPSSTHSPAAYHVSQPPPTMAAATAYAGTPAHPGSALDGHAYAFRHEVYDPYTHQQGYVTTTLDEVWGYAPLPATTTGGGGAYCTPPSAVAVRPVEFYAHHQPATAVFHSEAPVALGYAPLHAPPMMPPPPPPVAAAAMPQPATAAAVFVSDDPQHRLDELKKRRRELLRLLEQTSSGSSSPMVAPAATASGAASGSAPQASAAAANSVATSADLLPVAPSGRILVPDRRLPAAAAAGPSAGGAGHVNVAQHIASAPVPKSSAWGLISEQGGSDPSGGSSGPSCYSASTGVVGSTGSSSLSANSVPSAGMIGPAGYPAWSTADGSTMDSFQQYPIQPKPAGKQFSNDSDNYLPKEVQQPPPRRNPESEWPVPGFDGSDDIIPFEEKQVVSKYGPISRGHHGRDPKLSDYLEQPMAANSTIASPASQPQLALADRPANVHGGGDLTSLAGRRLPPQQQPQQQLQLQHQTAVDGHRYAIVQSKVPLDGSGIEAKSRLGNVTPLYPRAAMPHQAVLSPNWGASNGPMLMVGRPAVAPATSGIAAEQEQLRNELHMLDSQINSCEGELMRGELNAVERGIRQIEMSAAAAGVELGNGSGGDYAMVKQRPPVEDGSGHHGGLVDYDEARGGGDMHAAAPGAGCTWPSALVVTSVVASLVGKPLPMAADTVALVGDRSKLTRGGPGVGGPAESAERVVTSVNGAD